MFIRFKTSLRLLLPFLLLLCRFAAAQTNQVTISMAVAPPYSNHISDYTSQPGKIMATVTNTSVTGGVLSVYLQGTISSAGGIRVYTNPEYKMAQPLLLYPGQPYLINVNDLGEIFNENQIEFEGITKREVLYGNGLPEDDYQICLQAFDYNTNNPISGDAPQGCCGIFTITDVEPPVVLSPMCDDSLVATTPQALTFSWTMPPGTPMNTQYYLKMVEILPSERDPNEALNTAGHPVFFETTVLSTSFMFGPAQPALVEGKRYAFAITAIDPSSQTSYRNNGRSEVCSFVWKKSTLFIINTEIIGGNTVLVVPNGGSGLIGGLDPLVIPSFMPPTVVKGKLEYKYADPGENKKYPVANANIRLAIYYSDVPCGSSSPEPVLCTTCGLQESPPANFTLATAKTDADGNFQFVFTSDIKLGMYSDCHGAVEFKEKSFRFAVIMLEAPFSKYYTNPSEKLVFKAGDNVNVNATALVRSYSLLVKAVPDDCGRPDLIWMQNNRTALKGVNVYLLRKVAVPCYSFGCARPFPLDDAAKDPAENNKVKAGMEVVAFAQTGTDGTARFTKVVWHHNSNYTYYLFADLGPNSGLNYTMNSPVPFDPVYTGGISDNGDPATILFSEAYEYRTLNKDLKMIPQLPSVTGKVVDAKEPTVVIPYASVVLAERYKGPCDNSNITTLWGVYADHDYDLIKSFMKSCYDNMNPFSTPNVFDFEWYRFKNTDSDGKFAFENLPVSFNWPADNMITGPYRKVYATKTGYNRSGDYSINGYQPLSVGEKGKFVTVALPRGSEVGFRVVDGESGKGVKTFFRFVDDTKGAFTNTNGYYNKYPAKKLPGVKQGLIVTAPGYITDTLEVIIDQPVVDLGNIKIYTKKRRLKVFVAEDHPNIISFKPIADARVEILNVTQPGMCKQKQGQYYINLPCQLPLEKITGPDGAVTFAFENAGDDNNQSYELRIAMTDGAGKNYEERTYTLKIPYNQTPAILIARLKPATCISGKVLAGNSSVPGATVTMDIKRAAVNNRGANVVVGYLTTITDEQGNYTLRNVPVRGYYQVIWAIKSQSNFVGDSARLMLNSPSSVCVSRDFNLTVFNDIDITNLMGFPIAVKSLKGTTTGAEITGDFTDLPSNDQFVATAGGKLSFTNLAIKAGKMKNTSGVPVAEPVMLPVKTNENELPLSVLKNFSGAMYDNKIGVTLDKQASGNFGIIKGKVKIDNKSFNTVGFTVPAEIWLALNANPGTDKLLIPVIHADPKVKLPANVPNGFNVCDASGKAIWYGFNGFANAAETVAAKSFLKSDGLLLNTILHTQCNNVTPADQKIVLGDVLLKTSGPFTISNSKPLLLSMGDWKTDCSDWKLNSEGLLLNNAVIHAQIDVPVKNLKLTYNALLADQAEVQFDKLKLLGVNEIVVTGTNKGLNYVNNNGKMQWAIYASTPGSTGNAAYVKGLPGFPLSDPLTLGMISLYSNEPNTSHLLLSANTYRLFNIVDFTPDNGTEIEVLDKAVPPWCNIRGLFLPQIPEISGFAGNAAFEKQGNNLVFKLDNVAPMGFNHNGAFAKLFATDISSNLLLAKGTVEEYLQLLPVSVTMTHKPGSTVIDINKNEKIKLTSSGVKYFDKVVGGMNVENDSWNNFWFEGEMMGMPGISENANRLKFTLTGAITADGESVKVTGMTESFAGIQLVYDFPNSRLTGSFSQALNLGPVHGTALGSIVADGNGWYFDMGGDLAVPVLPGIGVGGEFYSLLGDYKNVPPSLSGKYGSYSCLPSGFQNQITGFLVQAGGKAEVLSGLHFDFGLASVDAGIEMGSVQRLWMTFNDVNTYGIALLQYGKIYARGGLDVTCTSVNAGAALQFGAAGQYVSNGNYGIYGCSSLSFTLYGEQCLGAFGLCSDECVSVGVGDLTIGLNVNYTSQGGLNYSLTTSPCSNHCP